jgi:nuclear-control-of-ATPase protein 2
MFVYEMHRDINRLKRVGEGRSLKFKWKEVHWIHWLMQWNLVGLPSAALKIWVAAWIHDRSKPYVPRVQDLSREAYVVTMDFIMTRFWTPFKDLVDELMNRKKGLVTGVSLDEEEASLDTMLMDLGLGDGTSATRHEATIKATRQYESYMKSGLMMHALGGRLARLMLIQVQQLKVSMLDAAETIDVLFQSNKINMQLLAVIPAVGILFVGAKVFVRFLFSIRAKDLRPITSVHAEMTDYLNELESNIILRKGGGGQEKGATIQQFDDSNRPKSTSSAISGEEEEKQQLGEFALTLYNYLLLLDHSSPQPFSNRQCDVIHRSLTTFLGRNGSFGRDGVTVDGQSRLLDLVKGKHQELSKFL